VADIDSCRLLNLPSYHDGRGSLVAIEENGDIPFLAHRIFYIYGVQADAERGGHAHLSCHQMLIAVTGTFVVKADDGRQRREYRLSSPDVGLYIPPPIWRELYDFSPGAVCLVLASELYDPEDYCRDYGEFVGTASE